MPDERYHIVLIQPPGYPHTAVFADVARLLQASLISLGRSCSVAINQPRQDAINIILGYQMLTEICGEPGTYIIYQLEQLVETDPRFESRWLKLLANSKRVWDYSLENINYLHKQGIQSAAYLPLGYHPSLKTIQPAAKDIDVLFYGSMNDRRGAILKLLHDRCKVAHGFGVYGQPRDHAIARSKIILNLHLSDHHTFEQVRVSYLLNNGCFVLSESSDDNPYDQMLITAPYDQVVDSCISWLNNDVQRDCTAQTGHERFKQMRMEELLKAVL